MQQQYCPSQGEQRRLHEEGAPLVTGFVSGSEGEEEITLDACEAQGRLAIRLNRTYKDANLRLHLPVRRFAGFFGRLSLICVLVALLFVQPQTPNHFRNNKLFALHSTEAVSPDNVCVEDLRDCPRRVTYVRRRSKAHINDGTGREDKFILASNTPYVFDAASPPTARTANRHQKSTGCMNSRVLDARGGPKKCALLVWAHDWPREAREGSFDWSRYWHYFGRELERREEYDTVVLVAPDVSDSDSVKSPRVTSLYHYAALLAQRTQHTLESLLGRGPEPERQAFTSERPTSPRSLPLAGDKGTTPPPSPNYFASLFRFTSESASDSKNESLSGRCTPISVSPTVFSSSPSFLYDCEGRLAAGDIDSSSSSAVPRSPRASVANTAEAAVLAASEHPENVTRGAFRHVASQKLLRLRKLFHRYSSHEPKTATTSHAGRVREDSSDSSSPKSYKATEVTEADDSILDSGSPCTRVDLLLLGRGVGGLALRLMSASPDDTLWSDPQDPKAAVWQAYVLNFHQWLSGKVLDPDGAGSSVNADLASGGTRERHQTAQNVVFAPVSSFKKLDTITSSWGGAGSTATSRIDSSDGASTNPLITPCTRTRTLTSHSEHPEPPASPDPNRRLSWSVLHYSSSDSFGLASSDEGSDTEWGATRLEEKKDVEEKEVVENIEEHEETKEDYTATPALPSRKGVRLRSVVLEETTLAGVKPTQSYKWSATREALRLSTALGRVRLSAQSGLNRILIHLDRSSLLCTLARAEKQSYSLQGDKAGSLLPHFEIVLYYGRMRPSKPDAAATELGISYPYLMQSVAAEKLRRTSDPDSPCVVIDTTVTPLNSSCSAFRLRRQCLHLHGRGRPRRGQLSCSLASVPAADPASKRTRRCAKERAAAATAEQKLSGTSGKWTRRRGACGTAQGVSTQADVPDAVRENQSQALSRRTALADCGVSKCERSVRFNLVGENQSQALSRRTALADCGVSKCERSVRFNLGGTICERTGAAAADTATSDTASSSDEGCDREGYEADSGSDGTSVDEAGYKQSKHTADGRSAEVPRSALLRSALLRSQLLQFLMPPTDVCKLTPRNELYDVTLTLLEGINPQQQPHPYNPVRVGVWKPSSTHFIRRKGGIGARQGKKDVFGKRCSSEALRMKRENVLLHMSVRAFQSRRSLTRWEFCGDKNVYSREWFTCRKRLA